MKLLITLLALTFSLQAIGQQAIDQKTMDQRALYVVKYEKFKKMRNTGIALTIAGGIMSVVGISQMSNAEYVTDMYGNRTTTDSQAVIGAVLFIVGAPALGGGITLTIVGSNRMKNYQQKLDGISLNLKLSPQQAGMSLACKF